MCWKQLVWILLTRVLFTVYCWSCQINQVKRHFSPLLERQPTKLHYTNMVWLVKFARSFCKFSLTTSRGSAEVLPVLCWFSTGSRARSSTGWVFSRAQQNSWKWSLSFFSTSVLRSRWTFSALLEQLASSSALSAGLRLPDWASSSRTTSTSVTDSDNFCWHCSNNFLCLGSITAGRYRTTQSAENNEAPVKEFFVWSWKKQEAIFETLRDSNGFFLLLRLRRVSHLCQLSVSDRLTLVRRQSQL